MRQLLAVLALLVLLPSQGNAETAYFVHCGYHAPHHTCVYDGDSFWLRGKPYRIEDIDTPEKKRPKCTAEAILAANATRRLIELLNTTNFTLIQRGRRDEDRWGRRLRTVEVEGTSIAATLIAEGLARPWTGKRQPWCI
jgi:endonuclease YncB( thermonuclease family)